MEIVTEQMIYLPGLFFFSFLFDEAKRESRDSRQRKKVRLSEKRQPFFHSIEVKVAVLLRSNMRCSRLGPIEKHSTNPILVLH